jgi:hypothetical protein
LNKKQGRNCVLMKLDLFLCLATAAYAAPIPRVQNAVAGVVENAVAEVRQAAPGLLQGKLKLFLGKMAGRSRERGNSIFLKKYAQGAQLVDYQRTVERELALARKRVVDLQAEVNELTNMRNKGEAWQKWSQKYLAANPGKAADIEKVIPFAESKLGLATKNFEGQRKTYREVKKLWDDPTYGKLFSDSFDEVYNMEGMEYLIKGEIDWFAKERMRFLGFYGRTPKTLDELRKFIGEDFHNFDKLKDDIRHLQNLIGRGVPENDEIYAKWANKFEKPKELGGKGRSPMNLDELIKFMHE